ncbi:MAG: GIY-YIG nuclease family protein [Litorimonas sp.]
MDALDFRKQALRAITNEIGCYVLCDLDGTPLYVGQSVDGIRKRVSRHLTSARSDIIANRQLDVWEVAYVRSYPVQTRADIAPLESSLFAEFDKHSPLINGKRVELAELLPTLPKPSQIIQVISDSEISERRQPDARLPRQAEHYARLLDHYLVVKKNDQIEYALKAHFERMKRYHQALLS